MNGALRQGAVATLTPGVAACQGDAPAADSERLRVPATVAADAVRTRVVLAGGGERVAGAWAPSKAGALVMPLPERAPERVTELCVESSGPGSAELIGQPTGEGDRLRLGEGEGAGLMRLEYLYGDGKQPLWGRTLLALPERIAAANGSAWAPWLVGIGLLAALGALAALLRGRRELLAVAVLAFGSGATWAGITPMFQASDEQSHAAYVQIFAELGHPPRDRSNTGALPDELACWANVTRFEFVRFFYLERPPWQRPDGDPCAGQSRRKDAAQYQAAQPPAYYALAMAGYEAANAFDRPLPDRLLLARLVSVLLAVVTILSVFLLVREAFPSVPWAARAAAAVSALQPVMMFNHSAINSDALVFATAAAVAAVLGRIWRRGPTLRRALLLGVLLGVGVIAKLTFLLVVPPAVAVQLLVWLRARELPMRRRAALLGASWAAALLPPLTYVLLADSIFEPSVQQEAGVAPPTGADRMTIISHVFQAFVPRLPFMEDLFPNPRPPAWYAMIAAPAYRLGWWNDYGIGRPWSHMLVYAALGLVACGAVAALRRPTWRLPLAAAAVAAAMYSVALVWALYVPGDFQVQARYMAVLLPVWGLAAGAAVAGLRPHRQGPAVALLACGMVVWSLLALEATLSRWYL